MQYIIMVLIVIGLAVADFLTGFIKAYCTDSVQSAKMRKGGLNKLGEIVVMTAACGLDIGINALGKYYEASQLSAIAGKITATAVFIYITVMEVISLFENYAEINPNAQWALKIIRRLKNSQEDEKYDKNI